MIELKLHNRLPTCISSNAPIFSVLNSIFAKYFLSAQRFKYKYTYRYLIHTTL